MNNEATPVTLVYLNEQDYQRNKVTMLTEKDGQVSVHKVIDGSKIIDGDDFIVEKEVVS